MTAPPPELTFDAILRETEWLRSLTRSLVLSEDRADEVLQETVLAAMRCRRELVSSPRAWLARVARRIAYRLGRRDLRRQEVERSVALQKESPSAGSVVQRAEMQRLLTDEVLRLPEPYRTTVLLRFLEGKSYSEIAGEMAVPVETVRTRVKRALGQMRRRLDAAAGSRRQWAAPILGATTFAKLSPLVPLSTPLLGSTLLLGAMNKSVAVLSVAALSVLLWQFWPQDSVDVGHEDSAATTNETLAAESANSNDVDPAPQEQRRELDSPSPSQVPAEGATRKTDSRRVRGRVLDGDSKLPLAGVRLILEEISFVKPKVDPIAITDAEGRFEFAFSRGRGRIEELLLREPDHARMYFPILQAVAKSRGDGPCDLGDILMPSGSLAEGRVLDASGEPVGGATLLWYRARIPGGGDWMTAAEAVGRSGVDGRYRLQRRFAPGYRREMLIAIAPAGVGWVEPGFGRKRGVIAGLDVHLHPSASLRVSVRDRFDNPVAGAVVVPTIGWSSLRSQRGLAVRVGPEAAIREKFLRTTANSGDAVFTGLPVGGPLTLFVIAKDHREHREAIELQAGQDREVVVTLGRNLPLTLSGRVTSSDGAPIAGAEVRAGADGATTNAAGVYRVDNVMAASGRRRFSVSARGFTSKKVWFQVTGPGTEIVRDITLVPASELHGSVVDQLGKPVKGAAVWIGTGANRAFRLTDVNGRFSFSDAALGPQSLSVIPPISTGVWRSVLPRTVEPGDSPVRIEVRREDVANARMEVEIVDGVTGQALDPRRANLMSIRGRSGVFAMVKKHLGKLVAEELAPGEWTLYFESHAGHRAEHVFEVVADQKIVRFRLEAMAPGELDGRVDVSGLANPPDRVTLRLKPRNSGYLEVAGATSAERVTIDLTKGDTFFVRKVRPDTEVEVIVEHESVTGIGRGRVASGRRSELVVRPVAK